MSSYTNAQILDALDLLKANAGNVALTSHESGIPGSTLSTWRDRAQEYALELGQADREGRPPRLTSRVAKLLAQRTAESVAVHAQKTEADPISRGSAGRKKGEPLPSLEAQLQDFLAAVNGELETRLPNLSDKDLIRLSGITADKLIRLKQPEEDTASGGSPFLMLLQAAQNVHVTTN